MLKLFVLSVLLNSLLIDSFEISHITKVSNIKSEGNTSNSSSDNHNITRSLSDSSAKLIYTSKGNANEENLSLSYSTAYNVTDAVQAEKTQTQLTTVASSSTFKSSAFLEKEPTDEYYDEEENHIDSLSTDIDDFIALIPKKKVQSIVGNYYHNDKEVQRALTYLEGKDFMELRERILNIQQVKYFLKYLNRTGLDALGLMKTLVDITGNPKTFDQSLQSEESSNSTIVGGLHGLVDDVLDILPQDQILSLFFEKLETSDDFSKFIQNVGSDEFQNILNNMEESAELRSLLYTLHNNGIYIGRIVESLKGYFFLGTF